METELMKKNIQRFAILGQDFEAQTIGGPTLYRKGFRVPTNKLNAEIGYYVTEGHGIGHAIPFHLFTKFVVTWETVEKVNLGGGAFTTTMRRYAEDETDEILAWATKRKEKKAEEIRKTRATDVRKELARLRKIVREVQTGRIGNQIEALTAELLTLCEAERPNRAEKK